MYVEQFIVNKTRHEQLMEDLSVAVVGAQAGRRKRELYFETVSTAPGAELEVRLMMEANGGGSGALGTEMANYFVLALAEYSKHIMQRVEELSLANLNKAKAAAKDEIRVLGLTEAAVPGKTP